MATIAVGVTVHHTTGRLGTALPPFVAGWAPAAELLPTLVAAVALAAAVALLPRVVAASARPWQVDIMLLVVALAVGLAVGAAREGTHGWWAIFDLGPGGSFEARNEYLPGLPALSYGVGFYLDRFAELVPSQPVNVAGHPPGPLLLAHALGIRTAQGLAALCVAGAAACAPLAHRLGRTLDGDRAGRIAGALCALSPIVVLFGFTSYDAVFAAFGTATAGLLVARSSRRRALGAVALAAAAFMSWALLAVGAWAAIVVWRREGRRAALTLAAGCGAALLLFNIILAAATGYDPIGTLRATEQVYRDSVAQQRPLWFWAFGSPVAWGVLLGPPIVALALRSVTRGPRGRRGDRDRDRHRRGWRLHEGRDRAHLALPGAAGLRGRRAVRPDPLRCRWCSGRSPRRRWRCSCCSERSGERRTIEDMLVFDTALGTVGLSWTAAGIDAVAMPRRGGVAGTRDAGDAPAFVGDAVDGIVALLAGARRDLRELPVDLSALEPFPRRVLEATRAIGARGDGHLRGDRADGRRARRGPGRRRRARRQPVPDRRPLPPRPRRRRPPHRLLGARRRRDQAPDAGDRERAGVHAGGAVRLTRGVLRPAPAPRWRGSR